MLLDLRMPQMSDEMVAGTIHKVLVGPGERLERGTPLLEVRVDLSEVAEQNCAPVFFFRMVAAEPAWLRSLEVKAGERRDVDGRLGVASSSRDEPSNADARPLRLSVGVVLG
jgi:hypothetical protein